MSNYDNDKLAATWYAFGRQDAEHNPLVDVFDFGVFYAAQRTSHGRSIQDAFATYVEKVTNDEVARRAATAPVIADSDDMVPQAHITTNAFLDSVAKSLGWDEQR